MDHINRILLVASETMLVEMIMRHLKRRKFFMSSAANDDEVKLAFNNKGKNGVCPYDLVIADLFGTRVNGLKFFKWLKKKHPEVPVLILSGYGTLDVTMQMLRPELDNFCRKPFTPEDIIASLNVIDEKMESRKKTAAAC